MKINTNMPALATIRTMHEAQQLQQTSMERLTSGKQINHAKDNASGMAVVNAMATQITGNSQAVRNLNDGMSLAETIDGAMSEVTDMFQRMRELGLQSLSGTYTDANREQMDFEFQALYQEAERIAETTKFNGISLFTSDDFVYLQGGWEHTAANEHAVPTIDLLSTIGDVTITTPGIPPTPATPDTLQFNAPSGFDSTLNLALVLPDRYTLNVLGNSIVVENNSLLTLTADADIYAPNGYQANQQTANFINTNITGYSAAFDAGDGSFVLSADDGVTDIAAGDISWTINSDALLSAPLSFSSSVIAGTPADPGTPDTVTVIPGATVDNIRTQSDAKVAVDTLDAYLERFSDYRAQVGAVQNQLNYSAKRIISENHQITDSRSVILDADYAMETARLVRSQTLSEAGSMMMAQSKALPEQLVSNLLR